jgi:hypothetical protein
MFLKAKTIENLIYPLVKYLVQCYEKLTRSQKLNEKRGMLYNAGHHISD